MSSGVGSARGLLKRSSGAGLVRLRLVCHQMEVDVEDDLASLLPHIEKQLVADTVIFLGELFCDLHHMAYDLLVPLAHLGNCRDVFFGNDQHVKPLFGIEIVKGHADIIFVLYPRGGLPFDDVAKNTLFHTGKFTESSHREQGRCSGTFSQSLQAHSRNRSSR